LTRGEGGAVLIGVAWVINSEATTLAGLAVGLTAGGYGAGSVATILPIAAMIESSGFQQTFFFFGILQGSLAFIAAWFLSSPKPHEVRPSNKLGQTQRDYTLKEALNTKLTKHIGKIYGVLYCAKGLGALFVPVGNLMMEATGTWSTVLYTVAGMDLFAAFLAMFVLRPTLAKHVANTTKLSQQEARNTRAGGLGGTSIARA